ncbi:pickpocket protein 28-like isoform X2 [Adelges cooleyi]|nr:pickpocket protein 28-like isoform X2 [Adelges cooleyi]
MTSLPGFHYFVDDYFSNFGKYVWAICLISVYALSGWTVYLSVMHFLRNSAIITLENEASSTWTIPFPAVTICSSDRIRSSVYNFSYVNYSTVDERITWNAVHSMCDLQMDSNNHQLYEEFLDGPFVTQLVKNLSFSCEELVLGVDWLGHQEDNACKMWFQETFTMHGLCLTFNMMPIGEMLRGVDEWSLDNALQWKNYTSNWFPETGFSKDALEVKLPMRTNEEHESFNFRSRLLFNENPNKQCSNNLNVYYILIHSPAEWPVDSHQTVVVPPGIIENVGLKPVVSSITAELAVWKPKDRQCYYQNEKRLKYFKFYTQKNCILECRSESIVKRCGCVPYYLFRTKNTPVCGPAKSECWLSVLQDKVEPCECLPDCNVLSFDLLKSNAINFFDPSDFPNRKDNKIFNGAEIRVFYQSSNYLGYQRITIYTLSQFVGAVGGLMGFYMGFSILILFELVYFITLRPFVNYWNAKKKMKKIDIISL